MTGLGRLRRTWPLLASILIAAALSALATPGMTESRLTPDGRENAWMVHRLANYGVISNTIRPNQEIVPSMRREPLPIVVGAVFYRVHPGLSGSGHDQLTEGPQARLLKQVNIMWAFALFVGIFALSGMIFPSRWLSLGSGALVSAISLHLLVTPAVDEFLTELPASALMVWAAIASLHLVRRPTVVSGGLTGLAFGLLALTKASFLYIGLIALVCLGVLCWRRARAADGNVPSWQAMARPMRALGLAALTFMLLCGAWMTRNLVHFGEFAMTQRAGTVLFYRSLMMEQPLSGAFYAWSPSPYRSWVGSLTGYTPEDLERGGRLVALHRPNPGSIFQNRWDGRAIYRERIEAAGLDFDNMTRLEQEAWLGRAGVHAFIKDPVRYVAWLPAFAYNGSFVGADRLRFLGSATRFHVAFLFFLNFVFVAGVSVMLMHERLFAVFLLPAGLAAFNVMLTHNIVRYNDALIPFILFAAVVSVVFVAQHTYRLARLGGAKLAARAPQ